MTLSRSSSFESALQIVVLASLLLFGAACSGGGGSSPTEPATPAPEIVMLYISWELDVGEGPVTGTTYRMAGNTVELWNREKYHTCWSPEGECGASCWCLDCAEECVLILDDDGEIVDYLWYPLGSRDIAECRTTPEGEVQAYYHDTWSGEAPGSLGPLVASGCSRAEQWFFYTECCLIDS